MSLHGCCPTCVRGKDGRTKGVCDFGQSLTRQEFAVDADMNRIMGRAMATGVTVEEAALGGLLPTGGRTARYGDVSGFGDFQDAQNRVVEGQQIFAGLPAEVRDRFKNDAGNFWSWATKEENREEFIGIRFGEAALRGYREESARRTQESRPVVEPGGARGGAPASGKGPDGSEPVKVAPVASQEPGKGEPKAT